jgi:hypothetical protein
MTISKLLLGAAVVLGSGGAALALTYDGDGNPVPGAYGMSGYQDAYASVRLVRPVTRPRGASWTLGRERDGDGNPVPGSR